ncbi:uncharacterized protein DNG_00657 [Cephalotrichum gorgonifer]|uniref:BZIP domain-containing protein n=1 Tax=Cephalotrichum gorgonifer TaxID=2041049 RepID=A0AAE8MPI4_9PEZI|nr:uncharacterized protein DNG_00657 [Cephalotrichum gorgonifer]
MASSRSPGTLASGYEYTAQTAPQGGPINRPEDQGPLSSLNIGFLKTLSDKKKTRDGATPKRRGPKPDSKPALTRRQELNRQAQRTHRERKELYIKSLEDEVLRLKETFSNVSQARVKLSEENNHLKAILRQNGIAYGGLEESPNSAGLGYSSSGSVSGTSYLPGSHSAFTPPPTSQSLASSLSPSLQVPLNANSNQSPSPRPSPGGQQLQNPPRQRPDAGHDKDYEQAGIDFVLT